MRMRRSHDRAMHRSVQMCNDCGAVKLPHSFCSSCGKYKGRVVINIKVAKEAEES
ncbi:hypothetical protein HYD_6940 [Candidatus Hydrogenosomobacter endosymbioticus]|uniref:Large ribosomal subunit protein bL32 n=2 Tax=Candidatus Hydrogenosomobacter endosymbioticus TaxID=2558174 RepID=A0ABM7V9V3_9PROT|nr:hypothetical protein HYD_6940 [Candidatus Hydrogenosomobacter endosymbioticus]